MYVCEIWYLFQPIALLDDLDNAVEITAPPPRPVPMDEPISYEKLPATSERGQDKLWDSLGYSYIVKKTYYSECLRSHFLYSTVN